MTYPLQAVGFATQLKLTSAPVPAWQQVGSEPLHQQVGKSPPPQRIPTPASVVHCGAASGAASFGGARLSEPASETEPESLVPASEDASRVTGPSSPTPSSTAPSGQPSLHGFSEGASMPSRALHATA